MLSFDNANLAWKKCLRARAAAPLVGERGPNCRSGPRRWPFSTRCGGAPKAPKLPDLGAMLASGRDVKAFGDPHFAHANIIKMCERPFLGVEAMDQAMWEAIERAHREADFVVCLGDWALSGAIGWARRSSQEFKGKHATIVGNHDAKGAKPAQWADVGALASLAFSIPRELAREWVGRHEPAAADEVDWSVLPRAIHVGLSHWPVPLRRMPGAAWINLHGHIHNRPNRPLRMNCSMEAIGFEPRSVERLVDSRVLRELVARQSGFDLLDDEDGDKDPGDAEL